MRAILCVAAVVVGMSLVRADEEKVPLDKVPKVVVEAVQKRILKSLAADQN